MDLRKFHCTAYFLQTPELKIHGQLQANNITCPKYFYALSISPDI